MAQSAELTLEQLLAEYLRQGISNQAVTFGNSPSIDAFSRLRVAQPDTLFDAKFIYDDGPLVFDTLTVTGGTSVHIPASAGVRMRVDGTDAARVVRQSHGYWPYQPGKSQAAFFTFVIGAPVAGVTRCVGYFDDDDGVFLEQADSVINVVQRSSVSGSPVDTAVAQSLWNLDTLDGSGNAGNPSGVNLDLTNSQILMIDLQWLGVGRARIGFDIDGMIVYVHEFLNANAIATVYMRTAVLPVRYEIIRTAGGAGNTDLIQHCSTVISEGGLAAERGLFFSGGNDGTAVSAVDGVLTPIMSIRPAVTFNAITNRIPIVPTDFEVMAQTNSVFWQVILNPTLTAPSFAAVDDNSAVEIDVAASAFSDGTVLASGYVDTSGPGSARAGRGGNRLLGDELLALDIPGTTADILTLAAAGIGGAAPTFVQAQWRELQ